MYRSLKVRRIVKVKTRGQEQDAATDIRYKNLRKKKLTQKQKKIGLQKIPLQLNMQG
jgi:hypothetical protein